MTRLFMGIDPGLDGAIATLDPVTQAVTVFDMPTFEITVSKKKRRELDLFALARWFDMHADSIVKATIEDPGPMPTDGAIQAFKFGTNCGVAKMAVAAHLIPMQLVRPADWKRAMRLTADKDASRRAATLRFPQAGDLFALKKFDGRAEAALLAFYGANTK